MTRNRVINVRDTHPDENGNPGNTIVSIIHMGTIPRVDYFDNPTIPSLVRLFRVVCQNNYHFDSSQTDKETKETYWNKE